MSAYDCLSSMEHKQEAIAYMYKRKKKRKEKNEQGQIISRLICHLIDLCEEQPFFWLKLSLLFVLGFPAVSERENDET